jgi:hypothetical protein
MPGLRGTPLGDLVFFLSLGLIGVAWIAVTVWYVFSVPYRLVRRIAGHPPPRTKGESHDSMP